jgi:3'(2'), 5'-bisphosphate nucleotidase
VHAVSPRPRPERVLHRTILLTPGRLRAQHAGPEVLGEVDCLYCARVTYRPHGYLGRHCVPSISTAADHAAAANFATAAGEQLLALRQAPGCSETLGARGDAISQASIVGSLSRHFPLDGVRSEESGEDGAWAKKQRLWVIDPLDGTREFSQPPRQDWAVHVALVVERTPVAGAVALPARQITLTTAMPPVPPAPHVGPPRLLVSRTRPPEHARRVADRLGAQLVLMGSAGAKAMALVLGEGEIYIHAGGQYEWDSAAPVAVATAAGLHASRLDGSPLRYGQPDPWLPDLLICRPELAASVIDAWYETLQNHSSFNTWGPSR